GVGNGTTADQLWKFSGETIAADGTVTGGAWVQIDGNIAGATGITVFGADHSDPMRLYASALTALGPAVFRSNDGGTKWVADPGLDALMTGKGAFVYQSKHGPADFPFPNALTGYPQPTLFAFDPDPMHKDVIVAGGADSGLFITTDNGVNWRQM